MVAKYICREICFYSETGLTTACTGRAIGGHFIFNPSCAPVMSGVKWLWNPSEDIITAWR